MQSQPERIERFPCFGGTVSVRVSGEPVVVVAALRRARRIAEDVHRRLTRFEPSSDLCRLNDDPRELVPAEPLLRRFAAAVAWAGEVSGGLVDATCLPAVEAAGYREHWEPGAASAGWTAGAAVAAHAGWADVAVEGDAVRRRPGTRLDSGGLGKGLAADLMAAALAPCRTWAIDCGGDLRVGGWEAPARAVDVAGPDGEPSIHRLRIVRGAIATSGVTRRAWDAGHHLIDPRTGAPADTGIIQATAVASTGLEAEVRAKTALLSGPERAADVLTGGGVVVTTGGAVHVVPRRNLARRCGNLHPVLRPPPLRGTGAARHDCHVDLVAISVSHQTAPMHIRERLALSSDGATRLTADLVAAHGVEEAVALCTCHRTEIYVATLDPAAARRAALGALARIAGASELELIGHVHVLRGAQVSRHLFAVAAGLESMVLGEAEIQGQVRRALERARAEGSAGPVTGRLFGDALTSGGRVRSRTALGRGGASVSSVAVELARDAAGSLAGRRVLVVGAGQSGALSARALADEGMEVIVASRHRSHAADVAGPLGSAATLSDIPGELERADVVFTATAASVRIIDRDVVASAMEARGGRPLVIVDLGMPRDVDPAAADVPGVTLLDLDDVDRRLETNRDQRHAHSAEAAALVAEEERRFEQWLAGYGAAPAVAALHEHAEAIVAQVLSENERRWEELSEADRERVGVLARTIVRRLLHEPTRRLRADGEAGVDAALELFGLADAPSQEPAIPVSLERGQARVTR